MEEQYNACKQETSEILDVLQDITAAQVMAGKKLELPSPPNIVVRILQAVQNEDSCFADLAKIIAADPALVAKLLKVANSSMYGFGGRINNIENALAILGINSLKNIALSFVIVRQMQGESDSYFDFQYFWKRSVTAAVAAKMLAALVNCDSDEAFVGALLQDIGVLVFFHHCSDTYMEALALKNATASPGHLIERQLFGLCHAELGGALLNGWGLPESICLPVFCHHRPDSVTQPHRVAVDIFTLADKISAIYHGSQSSINVAEVVKTLTGRYGLSEERIKELIDNVAVRANEVLSFFDIPGSKLRPLSEMLQEANRELGELNCSYEQLVMELKQAKEEANQYVGKLIEANRKYRELAYRDHLTGLYNRRYFEEAMENELARTQRYRHDLSLLFFDIDHFKEINDSHGHLVGHTVLEQVASCIQKIVRACDIVVRYGGDEFAVIMPETDKAGALIFAERLRRGIEELRIATAGTHLEVTISIGGATCSGDEQEVDKTVMLGAADQALYQAKWEGRNCVSIAEI